MTVEYLDPRADPGRPVEVYDLTIDLSEPNLTVGLLANGFPDSVAFLDQVERAMAEALPHVRFARYDKGNASTLASDQLLDGITAECRAVVTAYGH